MTEYSSSIFVLFFLSEYASILFLSTLTSILFFGGGTGVILGIKACIFAFTYIKLELHYFATSLETNS